MQRNCPHCGQEQLIADEDIVAPWVFTKCHSCGNLSVVRKEMIAGASARDTSPPARGRAAAILRKKEQIADRKARRAARTQAAEATIGGGIAPAEGFQRAKPEQVTMPIAPAIANEWTAETKLPPLPPPFLRKGGSPAIEAALAMPETIARKLNYFKPAGALLIVAGLIWIGVKQFHHAPPEAAPPPPVIEKQEVIATMSAPADRGTVAKIESQEQAQPIEQPTMKDRAPIAHEPAIAPIWKVEVARDGALLRSGPGQEYRKLGALDVGTKLLVRKWQQNWFQVELENLAPGTLGIGWIRGDLITQSTAR